MRVEVEAGSLPGLKAAEQALRRGQGRVRRQLLPAHRVGRARGSAQHLGAGVVEPQGAARADLAHGGPVAGRQPEELAAQALVHAAAAGQEQVARHSPGQAHARLPPPARPVGQGMRQVMDGIACGAAHLCWRAAKHAVQPTLPAQPGGAACQAEGAGHHCGERPQLKVAGAGCAGPGRSRARGGCTACCCGPPPSRAGPPALQPACPPGWAQASPVCLSSPALQYRARGRQPVCRDALPRLDSVARPVAEFAWVIVHMLRMAADAALATCRCC